MKTRSRRHALAAFLSAALLPLAVGAQMSSAPDTGQRTNNARLFRAGDAALAAGFAGLTIAMFPIDKSIARRLQHDTLQKGFVDRGAGAFEVVSVPGALIIGPAIYLYG